ncbi:MAG: hypothetical protein AAF333_16940 [Planctomycetota bacterium]
MTATLSQSGQAAFLDRNPDGHGLLCDMQIGGDGQFIDLPLDTPQPQWFTRFVFNPASAAGGGITVAGAMDADGHSVWSLRYDAEERTFGVLVPNDAPLQATLPVNPVWVSVEVGYDRTAELLSFWINGRGAGTVALPAGAAAVSRCWLGGLQKDHALTGQMYFDEWSVGDEYLGPVRVEPAREHADDPARWLVIYNTSDPESAQWMETYRALHGIPYANCLGLELPPGESISTPEYETMLGSIENYLDRNRLRDQIMGILVGYRVPGYAVPPGTGFHYPIPSLLHKPTTTLGPTPNPVSTESAGPRPRQADLGNVRLTARIDAPNLPKALELSNRAVALSSGPLPADARLYVDPATGSPTLTPWSLRVLAWYQSLDRQRLRMNATLSSDPPTQTDSQFSAIDQDTFYWGWGQAAPPTGFFREPAGPRVVCAQLNTAGVNATTLRSPTPSHWVDTALDAGYAAAIGSSLGYSADTLPYARSFFEALRRGWTLAEAYLIATPRVQDGLYLVGDPFLRVQLPKGGWDVFGPLAGALGLDPNLPAAALPADEMSLKLVESQIPDEDHEALYLVRRVDELGRTEVSFRPLRVGRRNGSPAATPPPIAWPDHDFWGFEPSAGHATATLILGTPANPSRLAAVELINDQNNETVKVPALSRHLSAEISLPEIPTRYRWRLTSIDGLTRSTPWSAPLTGRDTSDAPLTVLEPS